MQKIPVGKTRKIVILSKTSMYSSKIAQDYITNYTNYLDNHEGDDA